MSVPAVSGHQPNQFQPIPIQSGPSKWIFSADEPLRPTAGVGAAVALQVGFLAQSAQPLAPAPAPSPSQITSTPSLLGLAAVAAPGEPPASAASFAPGGGPMQAVSS